MARTEPVAVPSRIVGSSMGSTLSCSSVMPKTLTAFGRKICALRTSSEASVINADCIAPAMPPIPCNAAATPSRSGRGFAGHAITCNCGGSSTVRLPIALTMQLTFDRPTAAMLKNFLCSTDMILNTCPWNRAPPNGRGCAATGSIALLNASRLVGQRRSALESGRATNERMNASHANLPGVKRMQWVIYHFCIP